MQIHSVPHLERSTLSNKTLQIYFPGFPLLRRCSGLIEVVSSHTEMGQINFVSSIRFLVLFEESRVDSLHVLQVLLSGTTLGDFSPLPKIFKIDRRD